MMPIDTLSHDKKVIFWNRLFRAALLSLVIFISITTLVAARQVFVVGDQIKDSIAQGRKNREDGTKDTQGYIECIALLNKKYPNFNFQTASYDQAKIKLQECVQDTSK